MPYPIEPQADFAQDFLLHLDLIAEDFKKLEGRLRFLAEEKVSLERENAELKFGGVGVKAHPSSPSSKIALPVAQREATPPDTMEDQFEEAFGKEYQAKAKANVKFQQSQTMSRSNSGLAVGGLSKEQIKKYVVEGGPTLVILLNTAAMGIAVDNDPDNIAWAVLELFFTICYGAEFVYKLRTFGARDYFFGVDWRWNTFDLFCLILSVFDVGLTFIVTITNLNFSIGSVSMIKIARLARLLRLVRTLHSEFFSELRAIVLGVFSGLRTLFWAIVMFLVLIYVFGIAMATLVDDSEAEFRTLPDSMFTIFRCFTEGCATYGGAPLQEQLRRVTFPEMGGVVMFVYILVFLLVNVGIFNLIMAIFLDNVVSQQTLRKQKELAETALKSQISIQRAVADLISVEEGPVAIPADLHTMDLKHQSKAMEKVLGKLDLTVTRDRFATWLSHESFTDVLETAGIDTSIRTQLFDILDADSGGLLNVDELISGLMSMRGHVTKGDIIAMSLKVRYVSQLLETLSNSKLPTEHARRRLSSR